MFVSVCVCVCVCVREREREMGEVWKNWLITETVSPLLSSTKKALSAVPGETENSKLDEAVTMCQGLPRLD